MKRLLKFAARLYPAWWRTRYGAEFNALLEDSKPGWWDLPDILKGAIAMQMSLGTRAGLAVACGVAGAALTFGASFLMQPKYESTAIVVLAPAIERPDVTHVFSPATLANIIETRGLYPRERSRQSLNATVDEMNRAIQVNPVGAHAVRISFTYGNAAVTQTVLMDFAKQFIANFPVKAIESSSLPQMPVSPARAQMAIFGLSAGLLVALVLLVILPSAPQASTAATR